MADPINPDTVRAVDRGGPWVFQERPTGMYDPAQSPGDHLGRLGGIVHVPPGESIQDYGMSVMGYPLGRPPSALSGGAGNIQTQRHEAVMARLDRLENALQRRLDHLDALVDNLRDIAVPTPLRDPEAGMINRVFSGRPR